MALGPPCPKCGKSVPFIKTQIGLGKSFKCPSCGEDIIIPTNILAPSVAFGGFVLVRIFFDNAATTAFYIALAFLALFYVSRKNHPLEVEEYKRRFPNAKM